MVITMAETIMNETFDNILVWGLPGCGKSELRKFADDMPPETRTALHLGKFKQFDDYPVVASIFRVDDALELAGRNRLLSRRQDTEEGGFSDLGCWEMLDKYLANEYGKFMACYPDIHTNHTLLIECSRGGSAEAAGAMKVEFPLHHGYWSTLGCLPDSLLKKSAILYVSVSPETSWRKNEARYDPEDPLGTMGHMVPRMVMQRDYSCDDIPWMIGNSDRKGYVRTPTGVLVPIGILDNETEDLTTWVRKETMPAAERDEKARKLRAALENLLPPLYERYQKACGERG